MHKFNEDSKKSDNMVINLLVWIETARVDDDKGLSFYDQNREK